MAATACFMVGFERPLSMWTSRTRSKNPPRRTRFKVHFDADF